MSEQNIAMPGMAGQGLGMPDGTETPASDSAGLGVSSVASPSFLWEALKWAVSFPAMLGVFLVGATFYIGRIFTVDPDVWWHITNGQTILATHHWTTTDPYSFTVAGQPWIMCEWLGDVLIGGVSRLGGVRGLDALLIVLGSMIMIGIYFLATLRSGNSKAGFVAAAALFPLTNPSFTMRPQMVGYLFVVVTLIVLELFRRGKSNVIWFLPPMFLLWVNAHGSFIIGIGVIFIYLVCGLKEFHLGGIEAKKWTPKERIRLEFVFLLCLAVLPITPYGSEIAMYPFQVAWKLPMGVANVLEWQPMPFNLAGGKIFLVLVLGFFVAQMVWDFKWRLEEVVLGLGGIAMACLHLRFILLFVPFFAPLLATTLARWLPPYEKKIDKYILNAALIAGVIAAMAHYFPSKASLDKKVAADFPVGAVSYMREHSTPGPMYNSYNFGGYLIWTGHKVFVDGRADPYERGGVLADYFHIAHLQPGALAVLKGYGVRSCLLNRDEPLSTVLAILPEWRRVYSDSTSALFVRQEVGESTGGVARKTVKAKEAQ
jgi:hypothetical protein